jgi:hypothetical protein
MKWKADKILNLLIEFIAMTPNYDQWNEQYLQYNKPRLVRYQKIISLFYAFGLIKSIVKDKKSRFNIFNNNKQVKNSTDNHIQTFLRGDFINHRQITDYKDLIPIIDEYSISKEKTTELFDISRFFKHIMDYRIKTSSALRFNNGVLEASNKGFQAGIRISSEINKVISEEVKRIDSILIQLIDPYDKSFDLQDLIDNYRFPNKNLDEIDFENI